LTVIASWVNFSYLSAATDNGRLSIMHSLCFLLFQVVEMDPTDNQDELMHDLIRDSTAYVAPEFDEDENDGSQFLNLHYHGDEDQDISGEEEENVEEAEV